MALDELHRDEHPIARRSGVVDHDDVGVRHLGGRLGLAHEAGAALRGVTGSVGAHELDGDLAVQIRVIGGVDFAHRAAPDQAQHDEPSQRRAARQRRCGCRGAR